MADTTYKSPAGNVDGPTGSFANPTYAYSSDDAFADTATNGNQQQWTTFAFGISSGATIDGIEVSIEGRKGTASSVNCTVELSGDAGSNYTATGNTFTPTSATADTTTVFGSSIDLWGDTWADTDFSDANFRVLLTKGGTAARGLNIDHIQVKVYYTALVSAPRNYGYFIA